MQPTASRIPFVLRYRLGALCRYSFNLNQQEVNPILTPGCRVEQVTSSTRAQGLRDLFPHNRRAAAWPACSAFHPHSARPRSRACSDMNRPLRQCRQWRWSISGSRFRIADRSAGPDHTSRSSDGRPAGNIRRVRKGDSAGRGPNQRVPALLALFTETSI
jgi:hypothetical protein